MRDRLEEIKKLDAVLMAIDPHESWSAKSLLESSGLSTDDVDYPLLLDPTQTVSATYGVAFQMRVHTELSNRPATFVIDKGGVIRFEKRGKTFGDRPAPDQVLAELRKLH